MRQGEEVLIIEDDPDIRESLQILLEDAGFRASGAANGKIGLDYLRTSAQKPRLILLDMMMPVMDGYTFRAVQSDDPELAQIPVVVMTADGRFEPSSLKAQAQEVLRKPLDIDSLLEVVERHCLATTA